MTPDGYPLLVPPTSDGNRFLNALNYSDHTLRVFFDLARTAPYFDDTIFILVADHSRTGDSFNLANQHHVPLLIYAPGDRRARPAARRRQPARHPAHGAGPARPGCAPRVLGPGPAEDSRGARVRGVGGRGADPLARSPLPRRRRPRQGRGRCSASQPADPACQVDRWSSNTEVGEALKSAAAGVPLPQPDPDVRGPRLSPAGARGRRGRAERRQRVRARPQVTAANDP